MPKPIFDSLVEIASERHGYVTTRQARDAGVDPTQLRLLAHRGRLEHVARGVYRVPVLARSEFDDLAFAIAWARGRAVVSHESALILHRLSDVNPSAVHLTAPLDNHPRAQGSGSVRIHRRTLPSSDVTTVQGLPVTTVTRTLADCLALGTDPAQIRLAIRQARQSGSLTVEEARKVLHVLDGGGKIPRATRHPAASVRPRVMPSDLGLAVNLQTLARLCLQYGIEELAIFGSALSDTMTEGSDIDLLYVLRDGVRLGWAVNDLADDLTEALGRRVDLVAKHALHKRLRDSVLSQAQVLYAA